jgi:hypothetical protein
MIGMLPFGTDRTQEKSLEAWAEKLRSALSLFNQS